MDESEVLLKKSFLEETETYLSDSGPLFWNLEENYQDPSVFSQIIRWIHNIKGAARAAGFNELAEHIHDLESMLNILVEDEGIDRKESVEILLKSYYTLEDYIRVLHKDLSAQLNLGSLGTELKNIVMSLEQIREKRSAERRSVPVGEEDQTEQTEDVSDFVRIRLRDLEKLNDYVNELIIIQSILNRQKTGAMNELIWENLLHLNKTAADIKGLTLNMRRVSIRPVYYRLERLARDLAQELGKKVTLLKSGQDTLVDKTILENLVDPLAHLIRNAVDHGIEKPIERIKLGKNESGSLKFHVGREGDFLEIFVQDDGQGLPLDRLEKLAKQNKLYDEMQELTGRERTNLIFVSGLSSKKLASEVSGRGIGMDIVSRKVRSLGGQIQVISRPGEGTQFKLRIPHSVSLMEGMVVREFGGRYILPTEQIIETAEYDFSNYAQVGEEPDYMWKGAPVSIVRLSELLELSCQEETGPEPPSVLLFVRYRGGELGILVHKILETRKIMIKKLTKPNENIKPVKGAAIMSNGQPSLVLDIPELLNRREGVLAQSA